MMRSNPTNAETNEEDGICAMVDIINVVETMTMNDDVAEDDDGSSVRPRPPRLTILLLTPLLFILCLARGSRLKQLDINRA